MTRGRSRATLALTVVATAAAGAILFAQPPDDPTRLEAEAARLLAGQASTFADGSALADRLQAAERQASDSEIAGRLALLWVRVMRATLHAVPMSGPNSEAEPFRSFLKDHEAAVVYNEPGGEWLMNAGTIWSLQSAHRPSSSAEAIAWEAADNGLPFECEGYPPCELAQLDLLYGEYLRREPDGPHAAEAVRRIAAACDELQRLLDSAGGEEFFNPVTDCRDLIPAFDALGGALSRAEVDTSAARASLNALAGRCPQGMTPLPQRVRPD